MKTALIFAVLIILGIIMARSFIFPNHTVIHLENKSDKIIDSAIIHIQNYEIKVLNIAPQAKISREVSKDSIALNNHDITIRIELFDKSKSQFNGGLYYNDLSGLPNSSYKITLNEDLNTVIE